MLIPLIEELNTLGILNSVVPKYPTHLASLTYRIKVFSIMAINDNKHRSSELQNLASYPYPTHNTYSIVKLKFDIIRDHGNISS